MENNKELFEKLQKLQKGTKKYDEIRNEITVNNIKLVQSRVLRKYGKMDEDLIQAGCLGLLKAVERFDIKRGTEFSTYAVWWIDQAIDREYKIHKNQTSIPNNKYDTVKKVLKELENKQSEITIKDIVKETGYDKIEIQQILEALKNPVSLNYEPEDSDSEIADIMALDEETIEEIIDNKFLNAELIEVLKQKLTEKQQKIIMLRYGLYDGKCWTLEDVGRLLGVTRERIRQQETKALRIIKNCKEKNNLGLYIGKTDKNEPNEKSLKKTNFKKR